MDTENLISELSRNAAETQPNAAVLRLAMGVLLGAVIGMAMLIAIYGAPLDEVRSTGIPAFAMKLAFAATMACIGGVLAYMSGRPTRSSRSRMMWLMVPPTLIAVCAAVEMAVAPAAAHKELWLGASWQTCFLTVSLIAVPIFLGIVWGFEKLAPTELRETGCLAGVTAGAISATLYALYCPETTAMFLLSWYTLAIAGAGIAGTFAGPRLLRW